MLRIIEPLLLVYTLSGSMLALDLDGFRSCLRELGRSTQCMLDPGEYIINSPISVERSGITMGGIRSTDGAYPTLRRAVGYRQELLRIAPRGQQLSTITMHHLRIDGNRTNAEVSPANASADVGVYSTRNLLIRDCEFFDAPRHHVAIDGASSSIMVTGSRFHGAAWFGIWTDTPALPRPGSSTLCEKPPDLQMMNDMLIAGNVFEKAGANALFLRADNLQVIGNLFRDNHWEAPFNINGGQVDIINCAENVAFYRNHFTEGRRTANGWWADGFEIYSNNVALVDNTVDTHAGVAGSFLGVEDLFIAHWDPRRAFRANSGGPFIANSQGHRTVARVHIDRMTSVNGTMNYGVNIDNARTGAPIRGVVLTGSCLAGNREPSFLRGLDRDAVVRDNLTTNCGAPPGDPEPYTLPAPQTFDRIITLAEPVEAASLRLALTRGGNWATLGNLTPTAGGAEVTVHIDTTGLADGIFTARLMRGDQTVESFEVEVGHGGPLFTAGGVLNEAARRSGPLAPGTLIHIYGRNFGPPFPYEGLLFDGLFRARLAATRVLVNGTPAPILYAGTNDVVAYMPDSIAGSSTAILQVEDMGALSPPVSMPVVGASPGVFEQVRFGDGTVVTEGRPARPGDIVTLRATGLGLFTANDASAQPVLPIEIQVGDSDAELLSVTRLSPFNSGVVQLEIRIPQAAKGPVTTIALRAGDFSSNDIALPLQ